MCVGQCTRTTNDWQHQRNQHEVVILFLSTVTMFRPNRSVNESFIVKMKKNRIQLNWATLSSGTFQSGKVIDEMK